MERAGSHALLEPSVVLTGRTCQLVALVLADVLRDNPTLWRFAQAKGLTPTDVEALRAVARDLREVVLVAGPVAVGGETAASGEGAGESSVLMRTDDVAELLGIAPRTVRGLALAHQLPATKVGRAYLFDLASVVAYREGRAA
jgi:excisionase family DNA binding protein